MNKKSPTLVTTALEETWPKDKPILFLGKWCVLYNRYDKVKQLDHIVHPYHWDDKGKQEKDFIYLEAVYEELLQAIAKKLNHIHGLQCSDRYWRILLGSWLKQFIHVTFDRWNTLSDIFNNYKISEIYVIDREIDTVDLGDKMRLEVSSDGWNETFFAHLIQLFFIDKLTIKTVTANKNSTFKKKSSNISLTPYSKFRNKLLKILNYISSKTVAENDLLFCSAHLPLMVQFKLQLKLKQFPYVVSPVYNNSEINNSQKKPDVRNWGEFMSNKNDELIKVLINLIPKYLPSFYVENYDDFNNNCQPINFPKYPKCIFTGGSFYKNIRYNFWVASRVEQGTKLITLQHGGGYGITKEHGYELHEKMVSDYFISWGWKERCSNVISGGYLRFLNKKHNNSSIKYRKAILVGLNLPRYTHNATGGVINTSWTEYFSNQQRFIASLSDKVQDEILIKLYPGVKKYRFQKKRWQDKFPAISFADRDTSLIKYIRDGYLCICTYNSTTYIESLTLNYPTIIFWSNDGIRKSAIPYFNELKAANIFFDNPIDAAIHLEQIWGNISEWWESNTVQNARAMFCKQFCHTYDGLIEDMALILKNITK